MCLFLITSFVRKELTQTQLPGLQQTTRTVVMCKKRLVVTELEDLPPLSEKTAIAPLCSFVLSETISVKIL